MPTRSHHRYEPSRSRESGEHKLAVAVLQTTLHDLRNEVRRDCTGGPAWRFLYRESYAQKLRFWCHASGIDPDAFRSRLREKIRTGQFAAIGSDEHKFVCPEDCVRYVYGNTKNVNTCTSHHLPWQEVEPEERERLALAFPKGI